LKSGQKNIRLLCDRNPWALRPTDFITYKYRPLSKKSKKTNTSITVIGFDTEAYKNGRCFMVATSEGEYFEYKLFPYCLFTRKYLNQTFVTYNLSYDEGAIIQFLPREKKEELRNVQKIHYKNMTIKYIPKKFLRITINGRNSITFFDMLNFYRNAGVGGRSSLDAVSEKILGKKKLEIETKDFSVQYVKKNWHKIGKYCVRDAELVCQLGETIIKEFEQFGVYPRALYSTAYITYQYFYKVCDYVTVKRFWDDHRKLLDYALLGFNGGKFEITRKGVDYYYEYDIVSAYPYEFANLIDITHARVMYSQKYQKDATYGFLYCAMDIPYNICSPVSWSWGYTKIYPVGKFSRVITKNEYDYLVKYKATVIIINAIWLFCDTDKKPYYDRMLELFEWKKQYKVSGDKMRYHTVKILMNAIYGKQAQKIKTPEGWETSTCWNPIYAAIITANVRIRVSEMQQNNKCIVGVHTDSLISTKKLDLQLGKELGEWDFEIEGKGVVLGCGIYQINDKNKFRGFNHHKKWLSMLDVNKPELSITSKRPLSWREVVFHGWDDDQINRFTDITKKVTVNFDKKRLWLDDYKTFREVLTRKVYSVPHVIGKFEV
jgi:hypothetical protein